MHKSLIENARNGRRPMIALALLAIAFGAMPLSAQDATPVPAVPTVDPAVDEAVEEAAEEIVDLAVEGAESTVNLLEQFLQRLTTAPQSSLVRALMLIGGLALLVGGWRVYDFVVIIAGFFIGGLLAVALLDSPDPVLTVAALLIGGVLGMLLSYFLYYAAVFLIGAYIGIVLTDALATALALTPVSALALLIGGIIGGLVLIGLSFEFLVLLSALVGAQMLSLALGLSAGWTLIFAVIGIIIQLVLIRSFRYDFRRRRRRFVPFRRATA
jgi:hypothetical protein